MPREPPRRNRMKEWATPMEQQDLTLVGLSEDKQRLVLVSDSGQEFTLAADARLRAALRGEHARLGQLEITMESSLRPRDIQARIRAGESPEQVAAAAQTTLDKVMGYAVPVLAERAHIADRAQRASVRRAGGEGPSRVLADAVAERLSARNVDPGTVEWDAWRREDGRWALVADYLSGESARHAEFVFDAPGRYVLAEDDEARWLVGDATAVRGPQPRSTPGPRRLSAVGTEDELPLGEDAIELVNGEPPVPAPAAAPRREPDEAASQAEGLAAEAVAGVPPVEALGPAAGPALELPAGDADWIATQASDRPAAGASPGAPEDGQPARAERDVVELGSEADEEGPGADPRPQPGSRSSVEPEAEPVKEAAPQRAPRKSRGRASVPSWDEIMFGGGKRE